MDKSYRNEETKSAISNAGKYGILMATSLALLASPLVAPIMKDLSIVFAGHEEKEVLARVLLWLISFLPGEANINFLVKFIVLSVPALFIMIGSPIAGWIVDNLSHKKLLVWSLFLFTVAGTSGFFASSFTELFIGRALLGLAVAGIKVSTITMSGAFFKGEERVRFIGAQGSAMKIGGVIFMLLGGYLAGFHWSLPFWAYLLALLAVPNILLCLPESQKAPAKKQTEEKGKVVKINYLHTSYAFMGAFLGSLFFYLAVVQMSFFLSDAFQLPNFYTGLTIASANVVSAIVAFKFLSFKTRMSYVHIFAFIFFVMAIGYFVVSNATSYPIVFCGMLIGGLGFGLIVPAQSAWIIDIVPPEKRGFGVGVTTMGMFLGQFITPVAFQAFIDPENPFYVFQAAAYGLSALTILYAAVGFWPKGKKVTQKM